MKNYIWELPTQFGTIENSFNPALELAKRFDVTVKFIFNDRQYYVNSNSSLKEILAGG